MPVYNYGSMQFSTDDLENVEKDIEDKIKKSTKTGLEKAKAIRKLYVDKLKKIKFKILSEFEQAEQIKHQEFSFLGFESDPSKDIILIKFLIQDEQNYVEIFERIIDFIEETFRRTELTQFFIPKNFGDDQPKNNEKSELVYLKQKHTWDRINKKPYLKPTDDEEDMGGGEFGGPPAGPGGGFGPEPDIGGGPAPPEPEGGGEE